MPDDRGSSSPSARTPLVPPRIGLTPASLPPEVLAVFRSASSSSVSDQVGRLWTMDADLSPLHPTMPRLFGVAVTVKAPPGDNWAVYGGLNRVFPDAVLVIDWRGHIGSCGGGEKAIVPALRGGLTGVVIDGAWRDIDDIAQRGFPVFGRATSAFSPTKRDPGEVNVPVSCGGVVVEPGDVVVGDSDGVAVVPRRHAEDVAQELANRAAEADAHDGARVTRIGDQFEATVAASRQQKGS